MSADTTKIDLTRKKTPKAKPPGVEEPPQIDQTDIPPDAREALRALHLRREAWGQIINPLTQNRDVLRGKLTEVESQLYANLDPGIWNGITGAARHVLTLGRYRRTSLDGAISDLESVKSLAAPSASLERRAKALGLPTDPASIYRRIIELKDSLENFSATLVLDPATRNSRKMRKYIAALEAGDYGKALKLADKDPPIWTRVFSPWKAQAMREDKETLKAAVGAYRRTAETVKSAEALSADIEKSTAKALLKIVHSPEWRSLRARPGMETVLAASPELAILMKYDSTQGDKWVNRNIPTVLRWTAGNPSLAQLRADLLEQRIDAFAAKRPALTAASVAKAVGDLATQVKAAREDLRATHKELGRQIKSHNHLLSRVEKLKDRGTTIQNGQGVQENAEGHSEDILVAQARLRLLLAQARFRDAVRKLGPDAPEEARQKAVENLERFQGRSEEMVDLFGQFGKNSVSERTFKRMEKLAQTVAEGGQLPNMSLLRRASLSIAAKADRLIDGGGVAAQGVKDGTSFVMGAFTGAARGAADAATNAVSNTVKDVGARVSVGLRGAWEGFKSQADEQRRTQHSQRIEPVLA